VTGAAGFIGSHLCEKLLGLGDEVTGVDAFVPYYPRARKDSNQAGFREHPRYHFHDLDLRRDPLEAVVNGAELIFHLAAMPGLTRSWTDFEGYWTCNALATQRLLEACCRCSPLPARFIYASTSSVYGKFASGDESLPTKPVSPYGLTKLAGEHLVRSYAEAQDLAVVILRYFSVYGPRQRPDMGYYRFMQAIHRGEQVVVYGDGYQARGNTYVADCVSATLAAAAAQPGEVYNIGGDEVVNVWDILRKLQEICGRAPLVRREPARAGDQRHTLADTTRLRKHLGWQPHMNLDLGLALQWEWYQHVCG
jgi:nucleoside-diphosphate-sugar epimerase